MSFRNHINLDRYKWQQIVQKIAYELESIFISVPRYNGNWKTEKTGSFANLYFSSNGGTYESNVKIETDQKSVVTVKVKKLEELTKWEGQLTHDEDSIKRIIERDIHYKDFLMVNGELL